MKRSYLNESASVEDALKDLVRECRRYRFEIEDLRGRIKHCLDQAAAVHGIDPAAVRSLLRWMQQTDDGKDDINYARQEEIDAAYRAIVSGAAPVVASRVDTELDKVMPLVTNGKPPMIKDIMKAIPCSAGKAHKLRSLAAARLAVKSSSSREKRENENPAPVHAAVTPRSLQEGMLQPAPDQEGTVSLTEPESVNAPLDTSNVVSLQRSG
jgi:hypothetical protein